MSSENEFYYRIAPGIDVVPLGDGNVLFRSEYLAVRVEGGFSRLFLEKLLPLLNGRHSFSEIAGAISSVDPDNLRRRLDSLVDAQILRYSDEPKSACTVDEQMLAPFLTLLDAFGIPMTEALEKLGQARILIVGLEGHGAHLALLLARCGIGTIILADSLPCQAGNLALMPLVGPDAIGAPRQEAIKTALQALGGKTELRTVGDGQVTRESISLAARNCSLLAGCFDRGFSSSHHWINQASLEQFIPAFYAESKGHTALVGPLVLPGQTGCFMCYRMRSVACADEFNEAMSYEEFLDKEKRPALHERGVLPAAQAYIASVMALEIMKRLLSIGQLTLAGRVLEFDGFTLQSEFHSILQKPDCPICGVKKKLRHHPGICELTKDDRQLGDLLELAPQLVSRRTGVIRNFHLVAKDVGEPAVPYIIRAELANHRFLEEPSSEHRIASGKGITLEQARVSALGEAVERYSGSSWGYDEIVYARRRELDGESLDPREMVLFTPEQYEQLPYAPYDVENVIGWVRGRSLVTGKEVFMPAVAVCMSYEVQRPEEFIAPITSNGLAAGATLLDAIVAATFEILERDAFMITWLNRLPCQRIDLRDLPNQAALELCEAYRRRGVEMQLYRLPTDHCCHVFAAFAVQAEATAGPAVVVGLGADIEPLSAAQRAILEAAQVRPALRRRMRHPETRRRMQELAADPHLVTNLEDHDLLYANREALKAFDFLFERPLLPMDWHNQCSSSVVAKAEVLLDQFRNKGWDLLYYNMTPSDMEALNVHTVRVIVPGFQPIDFGWNERRLRGNRLYDLPMQLGFTTLRPTLEQLNSDPHPIS